MECVKAFIEACEIENVTSLEMCDHEKKRVPHKADELC